MFQFPFLPERGGGAAAVGDGPCRQLELVVLALRRSLSKNGVAKRGARNAPTAKAKWSICRNAEALFPHILMQTTLAPVEEDDIFRIIHVSLKAFK